MMTTIYASFTVANWSLRAPQEQGGVSQPDRGKKAEGGTHANQASLTAEQQAEVSKLQKIDREVRQHEMAHMAAGAGMVTSGASYTYTRGPDGQNYAVAGEVSIDTSPGRTPEETIARAERIQAAALAPAEPSSQDRSVAAQAAQMAAQARQELAAAEQEKGGAPAEAGVAEADPAAQQSQAVAAQKNQGIAAYQRQAVDAGAVGAQPSASPGMPIDLYA